MVSTRGGARTAPVSKPEPELSLRKKPVRKAAAAKAEATTSSSSSSSTKSRATRSKKAEIIPTVEEAVEEEPELSDAEPEPAPKPTKRAAPRAKKSTAEEPVKKKATTTTTKAPARATRTTRTKATEETVAPIAEEKPTISEVPEIRPQPATTRATRATRASAAKGKKQPLSPKKITQVSKAPARATRAAKAKVVEKEDVKSAPVVLPPTRNTRKRAVSDENAEIEAVAAPVAAAETESAGRVKRRKKSETVAEDAITISSRSTTPMSSPGQNYEALVDEKEEREQPTIDESESEADENEDVDNTKGSFDELCGPKTPMKRCSPRQSFVFASQQRIARMQTPVRRFEVYTGPMRTPQTEQKHLSAAEKQFVDSRPMTVARARDRAMVFQKLEPLPELNLPQENASHDVSADLSEDEEPEEEAEQSEIIYKFDLGEVKTPKPDETIAEEDAAVAHEETSNEDESAVSHVEQDQSTADLMDAERWENSLADSPASTTESVAPADSVETTIIHREESMNEDDLPADESIEEDSEELSSPAEATQSLTVTSMPQTLVWDNVREDTMIEVDFDSHLDTTQALPQFEATERLSLGPAALAQASAAANASPARTETKTPSEGRKSLNNVTASAHRLSARPSLANVRQSIDATVNFSDFIDVSSLAENPQLAQTPASNDDTAPLTVEADSVAVSPTLATVATSESENPRSPHHEPVEVEEQDIAIAEDIAEDLDATVSHVGLFQGSPAGSPPKTPSSRLDKFNFTFEIPTPHYALSTIASRRKSLPAISHAAFERPEPRPKTSEGFDTSETADLIAAIPWLTRVSTPQREEISDHSTPAVKTHDSPIRKPEVPQTPMRLIKQRVCRTEAPKARGNVSPTKDVHVGLHVTPVRAKSRVVPKTTPRPMKTPVRETPKPKCPVTPSSIKVKDVGLSGRGQKRKMDEYAKTAMPASRFLSPAMRPSKRPETARKPMSMREQAIRASTMRGSRTPTKTPLKAPAVTPGFVAMTPHPSAPLRGVLALVEVFTNEGASASSNFIVLLQRLGAKTTRTWSEKVTHVVFKDGSPATLQRLRAHNKSVRETGGDGHEIHCVNSRWVSDCDAAGQRLDESDDAYVVDVDEVPRTAKRRRKSMEPAALMNIGGNVVRDRKSSLGRSTLNRLSGKFMSQDEEELATTPQSTSTARFEADENDQWSPATPAYLAAPSSLVQQTAPMNRVRKLDLGGGNMQKNNRRLTFWNGGAN